MSFDWKTLPELAQAVFCNDAAYPADYPLHLGSLPNELAAAQNGKAILAPLTDRAWIKCSGKDAQSFLHNQLTSDVNHLKPGKWQHSSWCSAKGRMLASFVVAKPGAKDSAEEDGAFFLLLADELVPAISKRLKMYVLRAKVDIETADQYVTLGIAADMASADQILANASLPHPDTAGSCIAYAEGWVTRINDRLIHVTVSTSRVAETFAALAREATPVGMAAWHWTEVQAGLPLIRQVTQEEFVPQMVNFDKIGGVSFQKGCYPGQEIVARTQYLGKVKRHLYRVHAESTLRPGMSLNISDADGVHSAGLIANASASPNGGFDALAVILETAIDGQIHADQPDGPVLSSIALVTA